MGNEVTPQDRFYMYLGVWARYAFLEGLVETQTEDALAGMNRAVKIWDTEHAKCESPIEAYLLAPVPFAVRAVFGGVVKVECQREIGQYRVDLFFEAPQPNSCRGLIVECDGHDFHEKTKDQARRDKQRDRWFVSNGYQVLRFTGSEIWANPFECAKEIDRCLKQILRSDAKSRETV